MFRDTKGLLVDFLVNLYQRKQFNLSCALTVRECNGARLMCSRRMYINYYYIKMLNIGFEKLI